MTTTDAPTLIVKCERVTLYNPHAPKRSLSDRTDYTCTGPDGRAYRNTNKAELSSLLKRRYGRDAVILWEQTS